MHTVERYDAVIVGGGHNGLTAAAYLARAGKRVIVLERLAHTGGAAVSERPFAGIDARLSRYSYLVSLLPQQVIDDLGLNVRLARRRYSSYTPDPANPGKGLLVDNGDDEATTASLRSIGAESDASGLGDLHRLVDLVARTLWPTVTAPLLTRSEVRDAIRTAAASIGMSAADAEYIWAAMFEQPIGAMIEHETTSDLVRGVVLTDALIGTFARASDPGLQQNICFLYHLIGGGTGDWDVPIGGMGAVTDELARVAVEAGAEIRTLTEVTSITAEHGLVAYVDLAAESDPVVDAGAAFVPRAGDMVQGDWILSGAAPAVLDRLLDPEAAQRALHADIERWRTANGAPSPAEAGPSTGSGTGVPAPTDPSTGSGTGVPAPLPIPAPPLPVPAPPLPVPEPVEGPPTPEGAQVKVNLLVRRLPRLLDPSVDPAAAFGGTFHVNEGWARLDAAYLEAEAGRIPDPLPLEIYCHTLSDRTILSPELQEAGVQTLTVFGLHVPHRLAVAADATPGGHDAFRDEVTTAVLASLNAVLAEPIDELLLRDADGRPCIETRTTLDLERSLAMPGGNIFHGPLSWPFLDDDAACTTPAERWGVATAHPRILLCGAGARRGGAVSGLGGHNAAMAVLETP